MTHPDVRSGLNVQIAGLLLAIYLVVGRWSPQRLFVEDLERMTGITSQILWEPRFWILPLMMLVALPLPRSRHGRDLNAAVLGFFVLTCFTFVFLIVSVSWAPVTDLAMLKGYEIVCVLVIVWLTRFALTSDLGKQFRVSFWKSVILITGCMAFIAMFSIGEGSRLAVLGGGPNVFGRLMCLLALGCLGGADGSRTWLKWFAIPALGFMVLTGSRGAMVATALSLGAFFIFEHRTLSKKAFIIFGTSVAACVVLFKTTFGTLVYDTFVYRVLELTIEDGHRGGRINLLQHAVETWRQSPFIGAGISGFSGFSGVRLHPHNIFGELLSEGGLVAFSLFCCSLLCLAGAVIQLRHRLHAPSLAAAVLYFSAAQFSGDMFDTRGFFIFALVAVTNLDPVRTTCLNTVGTTTRRQLSMIGDRPMSTAFPTRPQDPSHEGMVANRRRSVTDR